MSEENKQPAAAAAQELPKTHKFLIGEKMGMTQVFGEDGTLKGVTVIKAGPCRVAYTRTAEKDGYLAVCLGFGEKKEKNAAKSEKGLAAKLGVAPIRHLREFRVIAVVLLVLTRSHSRIVRGNQHKPAPHAGVGHRKQRVRRHVQPHMLHRHDGAGAREGRSRRDFQSDFFVRRPLGIPAESRNGFNDFRRGRAGIPDARADRAGTGGMGDSLVSAQDHSFFCHDFRPVG